MQKIDIFLMWNWEIHYAQRKSSILSEDKLIKCYS